jgi:ferredoxin
LRPREKDLPGFHGGSRDGETQKELRDVASLSVRKIVRIDEEKCNGCGECIPSCAEGALKIIGGKARLVSDVYCDGLGACLGKCPLGAISIEERAAVDFDESAVAAAQGHPAASPHAGCPGSRFRELSVLAASAAAPVSAASPAPSPTPAGGAAPSTSAASRSGTSPADGSSASRLTHWPVQLALVPPTGPLWQDADVLIAADCVPFAMADFHEKLLQGKRLAIACPKLDQVEPYVTKLSQIFSANRIRSITVAHMEVPCCFGIVQAVRRAIEASGRKDLPVHDITVGVKGEIL